MISSPRPVVIVASILATLACDEPGDADIRSASVPASAAQAAPALGSSARAARPENDSAGRDRQPRRVLVNGIDLTGIGYDVGNPMAPIVLVNFSDFGCPYCGTFARQTYPSLDKEFVRTGKVFFKYVPFVMGMFPNGAEAARAAECAADQGRFWPMHDALYGAQAEWKSTRSPEPLFQRHAAAIGLDTAVFSACYADRRTDQRTDRANDRATRLGIRATPTFFVNDQQIEGALPLEVFRQVLGNLAP